MDAAETCCRAIGALGGLLLACDDELMNGALARETGYLIDDQIRQLEELLKRARAAR
jgi:hypothetical protein